MLRNKNTSRTENCLWQDVMGWQTSIPQKTGKYNNFSMQYENDVRYIMRSCLQTILSFWQDF